MSSPGSRLTAVVESLPGDSTSTKILYSLCAAAGIAATGALAYYIYRKYEKEGIQDEPPSSRVFGSARSRASTIRQAMELKNRGNNLFQKGQYEEAILLYTDAIRLCTGDADGSSDGVKLPDSVRVDLAKIYQNRAAAHEKFSDDAKVIDDCTRALELDKRYAKAVLRRAKAHERLDNYEQAVLDHTAGNLMEQFSVQAHLEAAEAALKMHCAKLAKQLFSKPREVPPLSASHVITFLLSFSEDPVLNSLPIGHSSMMNGHHEGEGDSKSDFDIAKQALVDKEYEQVIPACTRSIDGAESSKTLPEALLLRSTFYLLRGQQKESEADIQRLLDIVQPWEEGEYKCKVLANAYIKRGMVDLQRADHDSAMGWFQKAIDADPWSADAHLQRGQVNQIKGVISLSSSLFQVLANAYIKRGMVDLQRADHDSAMGWFQKAIDADPWSADAHLQLGQMNLINDNVPEAAKAFEKAVELQPNSGVVNVQKAYVDVRNAMDGQSFIDMKHSVEAFEGVVKRFPKCSEGYCLLAQIYAQTERHSEAIEMISKAIDLVPQNANFYVHKAICEMSESGDPKAAVDILHKGLTIDPNCLLIYENLGNIELQRGNLSEAMKHFEKGLRLCRSEAEANQLYTLLEVSRAQVKVIQMFDIQMPAGIMGLGGT